MEQLNVSFVNPFAFLRQSSLCDEGLESGWFYSDNLLCVLGFSQFSYSCDFKRLQIMVLYQIFIPILKLLTYTKFLGKALLKPQNFFDN